MPLTNLSGIARSKGDPRVEHKGPSSLPAADRLARTLGWMSIGLGVAELVAPGRISRALGLEDKKGLIRAYGARELASAVPTLSVDRPIGLGLRIGGDALDLATLATALRRDHPKRTNALVATALIAGITLLDVVAYAGTKAAHHRNPDSARDYSDRSGWPRGVEASRGAVARTSSPAPKLLRGGHGRRRAADARVMSATAAEVELDSARAAVTFGRPSAELRTLWL